jgi:hypothetical protein
MSPICPVAVALWTTLADLVDRLPGVSVGLRDLDAKSLRGVREATVVAVQTL